LQKKLLPLHAKDELAFEDVTELLAAMGERFRLRLARCKRLMHH
jgi:hypothetical protein